MFVGLKKFVNVLAPIAGAFALINSAFAGAQTIKWPKGPIKIAISSSVTAFGTGIKPGSDFRTALAQSLEKWEEAAGIEFDVVFSELTSISPPGPSGDGVSLITIAGDTDNFLAFSKDSRNASAITRLFYDGRGNITEADIVLNPAQQFSSDQMPATFDLETVLTHEIGHLLGLKHTTVPSSAMFDGIQRNSVIGTDARPKQLSIDDLSKIRALYGPGPLATKCCSSIAGKAPSNSNLWLHNFETGALVQSVKASKDGTFEFGGVDTGKYQVVFQQRSETGDVLPVTVLGNVSANPGENRIFGKFEPQKPISFMIDSIGLTGQVSNRALRVAPGEIHRITTIGTGLKQDGLTFATTSPKISLIPLKLEIRDYPGGVPALGFELIIDPNVKPGQYSIYAEDKNGQRNYFHGGIWVE